MSDGDLEELKNIKKLLKTCYSEGVFITHVSLINPKGKFQFNRNMMEEFWNLYCTLIESDENPDIGLAEKPQDMIPVLVDVDLKIRAEEVKEFNITDRLYTEVELKSVVAIYQSILRSILDTCTDVELTCVVLEKSMYQSNKNDIVLYKHGFHLHFPYIFLKKEEQDTQLIPRVKDEMKKTNLFVNIGVSDPSVVIDAQSVGNTWLLYGSKKDSSAQAYRMSKIYDSALNEIDPEKAFKFYNIFDFKHQPIPIKGNVVYFLPRILSIVRNDRPCKQLKKGLISPLREQMKKEVRKSSSVYNSNKLNTEESMNLARNLLPLVGDFRADNYADWMAVGWSLFNISDGSPEGLDMWCEFSSRCIDKYDENECIGKWNKMTKTEFTIGTLRYYANLDNPELYRKFKQSQSEKHVKASLEASSHNDVAKALREEYGDEFVCSCFANKTWYKFENHIWRSIECGIDLREKISSKIVGRYSQVYKKLIDELNKVDDKASQASLTVKMKQVQKMIGNLKNANYKDSVMKECAEEFYDSRFQERLDANPYLIAFNNGVYDLKLNIFRAGRPEDFISKSMPINYICFTEDDERVQEVYTFLEQVFPDKSVRKYFMDVASDVFVGGNHEKSVYFWTGEGDNGKSVTQSFFDQMLGKLCIKLNTNIITGKKPNPGAAFADLARAGGGVRWVVMEEPDSDEIINSGIFKHISGNDKYYARDLFEKGKDVKEITPMFKVIIVCNKLPRIKGMDKAVANRVKVIPFESTFCKPDNPAPESYEEQLKEKRFPMDKKFSQKIPNLLEPFAWILLQHRLKITTRFEPEKVRFATELYLKQNDIYKQFSDEVLIEDSKAKVSSVELFTIFRDWCKNNLPNHVANKSDMEDYFNKVWGFFNKAKIWEGHRARTQNDSILDGSIIILDDKDKIDYSSQA